MGATNSADNIDNPKADDKLGTGRSETEGENATDEAKKREAIAGALQGVERITRWSRPSDQDIWIDGLLRYHLVADGYISSSEEKPLGAFRSHWLYALRSELHKLDQQPCVGFSYSRPGYKYPPLRTRIDFRQAQGRLRAYAPQSHHRINYYAFSLAGPLFVRGLAYWARSRKPSVLSESDDTPGSVAPEEDSAGQAPGATRHNLVLVQPAFLLPKDFPAAIASIEQIPQAIHTLAASSSKFWGYHYAPENQSVNSFDTDFLDSLILDLKDLTKVMNVILLHWSEDQFIAYPPKLLGMLEEAGVDVRPPLILDIASSPDPKKWFHAHADVSRHTITIQKIIDAVAVAQ